MSDGKKRTASQRIGTKGEHLFAAWAVDMGLTANKCQEDVGIDFFCQVLAADGRVAGAVLAVQVKSSETFASKRLVLSRDDVASALRIEHPFCLVGADTAFGVGRMGFRFLDRELFLVLQGFLRGRHDTWSMKFSDLARDRATFRAQLDRIATPGFQQKLCILREQEQLRTALPFSRLTVVSSEDSVTPVVHFPWIGDAFTIDPEHRGEVLRRILVDGEAPSHTIPGMRVHQALQSARRLGDSGGILVQGLLQKDSNLVLTNGQAKVSIPVKFRAIDGDVAWATRTGLVFTCGKAVSSDGVPPRHPLGWSITRQDTIRLGDSDDEMAFLRNLHPEARLSFGADLNVGLWGLLDCFGDMIEALELVCRTAGVSLTDFRLADFENEEFRLSVMVLDAVARGVPLQEYMMGFVLGPAARMQLMPDRPGWYEVPLVANLGEVGVVVWLRGKCLLSVVDNQICGFQPISQVHARWELGSRLETGGRPQVWVCAEWPGIELIDSSATEKQLIGPASHTLGGRNWFDNAPGPDSPMPTEWLEPK